MTVVIVSDKSTKVTRVLPNLLDDLPGQPTAKKTENLRKLYANAGGDPSYITDSNSDSILTQLNSHRSRVASDGGFVLSNSNTLRAIIFAMQNGITSASASAYSPDFGVKLVSTGSTFITKVYDLFGRDMRISTGTFESTTDAGFNVLKNAAAATMISESSFLGGQGMILGVSLHDGDAGSSSSQAVKGMYMSDNANATGVGVGYLESNQGGVSRFYYKQTSGTMVNISYDQTSNYKKYSGLVGYMSNSNSKVEIYENGSLKTTSTAAQSDLTAVTIFPTISALSANSFIRESWLVKNTSQTLAIALSNYLNKSV